MIVIFFCKILCLHLFFRVGFWWDVFSIKWLVKQFRACFSLQFLEGWRDSTASSSSLSSQVDSWFLFMVMKSRTHQLFFYLARGLIFWAETQYSPCFFFNRRFIIWFRRYIETLQTLLVVSLSFDRRMICKLPTRRELFYLILVILVKLKILSLCNTSVPWWGVDLHRDFVPSILRRIRPK